MRNCYADPTANTAIANVDQERRREENRNYAPKAFQALSAARVERKGLLLVMIVLPLVLLVISYVLYVKHYTLDEPEYDRICAELKARRASKAL